MSWNSNQTELRGERNLVNYVTARYNVAFVNHLIISRTMGMNPSIGTFLGKFLRLTFSINLERLQRRARLELPLKMQ